MGAVNEEGGGEVDGVLRHRSRLVTRIAADSAKKKKRGSSLFVWGISNVRSDGGIDGVSDLRAVSSVLGSDGKEVVTEEEGKRRTVPFPYMRVSQSLEDEREHLVLRSRHSKIGAQIDLSKP